MLMAKYANAIKCVAPELPVFGKNLRPASIVSK